MKKLNIFLLLFISFLWLFYWNNVLAENNEKVLNFKITSNEKLLFKTNSYEELDSRFKEVFSIKCEWDNDFICKKWWEWKINDSWCWIERKWNSLWRQDNFKCSLIPKIERQKTFVTLNFTALPYYKNYQYNLDISNKFPYKRIQQKELSCESSATADIISAINWYKITEDDIISRLPKSDFYNKIAVMSWWKRIWWDPDKWFVWYIDKYKWKWALQYKYQWYGVNELPIQKVYSEYWIKTEIINEFNQIEKWFNYKKHLTYLLISLNEWKFIQLWGDICTYPEFEDWQYKKLTQSLADKWYNWLNNCLYPKSSRVLTWYAKEKDWSYSKIEWLNWEHAFYLLWYKWWVENPTHIIVWDTNTWKHTYKTEEWLRKWWKMQYRSIITQ